MNKNFIRLIRVAFIFLCCITGWLLSVGLGSNNYYWVGTLGGVFFGIVVIFFDHLMESFSFRGFSKATFGLMVGMFCAWLLTNIDFFDNFDFRNQKLTGSLVKLVVYYFFGYIGIVLALRANREEFSLLIPYVRFKRENTQDQITVLDTNIVIDGRIPALVESGFLKGEFIIPRFIVDELHHLANSNDLIKNSRGKRGLENIDSMLENQNITCTIYDDRKIVKGAVDEKLIELVALLNGRLLSNDVELVRVAKTRDISVLSLDNLSKAMRPIVRTGDEIELLIIKKGKDEHQGIGYLNDGTMLVVNKANDKIGTYQKVVVGGTLQTSAGRLIFAELSDLIGKEKSELLDLSNISKMENSDEYIKEIEKDS